MVNSIYYTKCDTLYVVTCSSPGAPYPTSGAEAPAALQQFIHQEISTYLSGLINLLIRRELEMVDIGDLVSQSEIQFASLPKVLSIQSFHQPAKVFK